MKDERKIELALSLIERGGISLFRSVQTIRASNWHGEGKTIEQSRLGSALRLLDVIQREIVGEHGPDEHWWRQYFILMGMHMHLTEEGWIPAEYNTREHTGEDPAEVLDEICKPKVD